MVARKDDLPNGWIEHKLEDCVEILDSKRIPINANERKQRQGNVPYFGSTGQVGWIDDYLFNEELVLLGEDAAPFLDIFRNKAYLISGKSWVNNHAHVLKTINNLLSNRFLCYFLNQFDYHEYVTGTTRLKLNQKSMRMISILLPPLNEQKQIVIKIESIFAQIDATKEQLEMLVSKTKFVPSSLNTLRNSVLKQAFEGKLVPQDLNDEPAEILLKRISKDFKGLILKNDRLPKGWTKTNVGQLYDIIGGGTPSTKIEKYWKGNIPWISSADIYDLYDIRPRRSITVEAVKSSATNLVPSESIIVVTRVGLGKIAYTKTPICFSQDSQALVGNNSIIDPHYALYYLSKAVQIFKYSNRGTTISGVTKKQLSELSFFLPPLNEQKRIVAKIESIFGNIDSIEKQVNDAIRSLNTLKQSVLKLAFEGKLVPQDPSDEPASVLLEKIKLQKK